jgi:hypothetical protein
MEMIYSCSSARTLEYVDTNHNIADLPSRPYKMHDLSTPNLPSYSGIQGNTVINFGKRMQVPAQYWRRLQGCLQKPWDQVWRQAHHAPIA